MTNEIVKTETEILEVKPIDIESQIMIIDDSLIKDFINYVDVKEITLRGYRTCLKAFNNYLKANNITQPTRDTIKAYKSLLDTKDLTAGTKRQYLRAVKQFYEWTDDRGLYPNIARNIKTAKVKIDNTKKDSFSEDDIQRILSSIDTTTERGARDYSIILLCVLCGLRIIEVQRANIEDIQEIKGQTRLYIQGKGHDEKDDYKKIIPELKQAIENYLSYRQDITSKSPLFSSLCHRENNGGRLTEPSISRIIKTRFKDAGYNTKRLTAHSLRHTSNSLLFKAGADLYQVQKHARHQDPKTTEIYIHENEKENAKNEELIYNQIFKQGKQEKTGDRQPTNIELLDDLSTDDFEKVKAFIESLKEV